MAAGVALPPASSAFPEKTVTKAAHFSSLRVSRVMADSKWAPGQPGQIWMVTNASSGSHDIGRIDAVERMFEDAGHRISRRFTVGESPLPSGDEARGADVALVILHGGDGTISSAASALDGWDGDILVLPGGTMNLLSRALHGDRTVEDIARHATGNRLPSAPVPTIVGEGHCAISGIIAGPTTIWGDVREQARHADIAALASTIPEAVSETLSGDDIMVEGDATGFQAIHLQPSGDGIAVRGILARNAAHLLAHGWAWLSGDFREGPHVSLGVRPELTLHGPRPMGLLVDGEKEEGAQAMTFRRGESCHRYLSCLGGARWP